MSVIYYYGIFFLAECIMEVSSVLNTYYSVIQYVFCNQSSETTVVANMETKYFFCKIHDIMYYKC